MHCKDTIPKTRNKYSQERNCAATVPIPTSMFLWAIYMYIFFWSVSLFCCRKIGGPNVGIYRSLTLGTRRWKLGLRTCNLFWEYITPNFFAVWSYLRGCRYNRTLCICSREKGISQRVFAVVFHGSNFLTPRSLAFLLFSIADPALY